MKYEKIVIWILFFFLFENVLAQVEITGTPRVRSMEELLTFAMKQQKKPYRIGAEGPHAFDCSGFTRYCYKQAGIDLNRTSKKQAEDGKRVRRRKLKEGDLVFFKGSKGRDIDHVGIVFKKNSGKKFDFIHASTSSGIIIESSEVDYFKKRYKTARRITSDKQIRKIAKTKEKEQKALEKERKNLAKLQKQTAKTNKKQTNTDSKKQSQSNKNSHYTVKKGDTLYSISRNAGCSVDNLKQWNNLKGNEISVGQKLIVK